MKNKKFWIAIISVVALALVIIGVTYAYWLVTKTQTRENVISTGCLDITLNGEANDINLPNQFPMSDEDGMKLTPYEFTITNNCTTSVDYHVNLESIGTENTAIKASAIKAELNENDPKLLYDYVGADPTINGAYESYTLLYGTLAGSSTTTTEDTATYNLRLWIDADAPISEMNKTYEGKISVSVGQNITSQGDTLASLILADAEENNYLYTTTDFSKTTADGEYGLYSAPDDYGTSYYFRGDVENNRVEFGKYKAGSTVNGTTYVEEKPMYWRIVRINGDGTVKMIYDGISPLENGMGHTATITDSMYNNDNYDYLDAKLIGYTYDEEGTQVDSEIKSVIDSWYETNLENEYEKYIADSIFCNDREITNTSESQIRYAGNSRINSNSPKLSCTQDTDKYTVSKSKGNGLLEHPIGLITVDEVAMAGFVSGTYSYGNYLNNSKAYWTMTPVASGIGVSGVSFVDNSDRFTTSGIGAKRGPVQLSI